MLSTRLWQRFGADAAILGKTIRLDGIPYTITGVMPASFRIPIDEDSDFWTPLYPDPQQRRTRGYRYLICAAKQRAGVTTAQMTADLQVILTQFTHEHPKEGGSTDIVVTPQRSRRRSPAR